MAKARNATAAVEARDGLAVALYRLRSCHGESIEVSRILAHYEGVAGRAIKKKDVLVLAEKHGLTLVDGPLPELFFCTNSKALKDHMQQQCRKGAVAKDKRLDAFLASRRL